MAQHWAIVLPDERLKAERLYHHDTVELAGVLAESGPAADYPDLGDEVVLVTSGPSPRAVASGRIGGFKDGAEAKAAELHVTYTRRAFDHPAAVAVPLDGPATRIDADTYAALVGLFGPPLDKRTWLVSVDLPIEATSQAEAVRLFWSYVRELGPAELPAFVSPSGDELAMQAFVLGEETNLDPEEEED